MRLADVRSRCAGCSARANISDHPAEANQDESTTLSAALESITYLALECHHPGWEINDGACGELVIDVTEANFVLDCQLRYTATDDHSTQL